MGCMQSAPLEKQSQETASADAVQKTTAETPSKNILKGSEDGGDDDIMFYDAVQSFSDIFEQMSYAPASTMPGRGASIAVPSTMLSSPDTKSESSAINPIPKRSSRGKTRNSVMEITQKLGSDSASKLTIQGYPGNLNQDELEACLKFREALKQKDVAYKEMVHAYAPAEEEAYALCRFLRARAFDVDEIFAMLEGNNAVEIWKTARENNYYRDMETLYNGCPLPVFMHLFPVVISGLAKNGTTMFYFKPGMIDMEALECVADLPEMVPYLWNMLHAGGIVSMQRELAKYAESDKIVLAERIIVVDMKSISTALFNTEFMKEAAKITACFPETMNRTYMLNVPTLFTAIWSIVKLFLEPRTIQKIGFFARENKAKQDLLNFVDADELLYDYGGHGPSFDEVLQERQAEAGNCSRWVIECIPTGLRNPHFPFDLSNNESVSSIAVYSKGDNGAEVSIKMEDGTIVVPATTVKRPEGSDNAHFSTTLDHASFEGKSGTFEVEAIGRAKEHYLVTIGITTS